METKEYRVFGPPGTGKTTYLERQIARARREHQSSKIFITSFTKAAALELARRDDLLPKSSIGTLHAHCYRALGHPELAEKHVGEFNSQYREFAISAEVDFDDPFDQPQGKAPGAAIYQEMNRLRNLMVPKEMWPMQVRALHNVWEDWKKEVDLYDFTELLEIANEDIPTAPNDPEVGFVDEAQDMTPLQFSLIRKWGRSMDTFILVGDEDQCLYSFTGATPESLLSPELPEDRVRVLGQSYRVPRQVLSWANRIITKVSRRQDKEYRARDLEGEVALCGGSANTPGEVLPSIEKDIDEGKSVMVLASCAYMLNPMIAMLRENGIPFHNPYRRKQGAWNPLHRGRGTSSIDRLISFLRFSEAIWGDDASPSWTTEEASKWIPLVSVDAGIKRGVKTAVKRGDKETWSVSDLFEHEAGLLFAFGSDKEKLDWLRNSLTADGEKKMSFPMKILDKDIRSLVQQPRIITGTIHSVKGGEADSVYILPDFSRPQMMEWHGTIEGQDNLRRLYYVAGTRAREKLVLCQPSFGVQGFPLMEGLS